jgi:hypothetical protein
MPTMQNTRLARVVPWIAPLLVLPVAACGDDDGGGGAAGGTTAPAAAATAPGATDVPVSGNFVEILVNADDAGAYGQVEQVALGQTVVLALLSDTDREYHVHGYDLVAQAPAATEQVFEFTADRSGRFDVEDHVSGEILRVLEVG